MNQGDISLIKSMLENAEINEPENRVIPIELQALLVINDLLLHVSPHNGLEWLFFGFILMILIA